MNSIAERIAKLPEAEQYDACLDELNAWMESTKRYEFVDGSSGKFVKGRFAPQT